MINLYTLYFLSFPTNVFILDFTVVIAEASNCADSIVYRTLKIKINGRIFLLFFPQNQSLAIFY